MLQGVDAGGIDGAAKGLQFRLLLLYAAWWFDKGDRFKSRSYISSVKFQAAEVLHDIVLRSVQVHGALGCSNATPLANLCITLPTIPILDASC